MKRYFSLILSVIIVCMIQVQSTQAFIGLVAEVGDILNISKWNEMIVELNQKIEPDNLIEGSGISLTQSGSDITFNAISGLGVAPFLSSSPVVLVQNNSYTLSLEGQYFSPNTTVDIPGLLGSIDNISVLTPGMIDIDITIGNTTGTFDFVLDNAGVNNTIWPSNGVNQLTVVTPVTGTGPAGTYSETFEASLGSWSDGGGQETWTRDSGGTPSGNTGPNVGSTSVFYVYTEATGNGTGFPNRTFILETSNFNIAQSISFDYHAFGATIGTLELQTFYNGVWTTRDTITGQQQTAQGDPYLNRTVDLSSFPIERIRFFYTSGSNFTGDIALDNISIISN